MFRLLVVLLAVAVMQEPVRLLQIDAVALDRNSNPVSDLKREDVEVWISGRRIPVESITRVNSGEGTAGSSQRHSGRLIALLLDDLTVDPRLVPRVREVARRVVSRLGPDDRMAIVTVLGGLVDFTNDSARLLSRAGSYNQSAAFVPLERIGAQVLTTIAGIAREMNEAPERRKAIVAIGSGALFDTPIPPPQVGRELQQEWLDAVREMAAADVAFYVIDPGGVGSNRAWSGSDGFARDAGGHAFVNTNDLKGAVDQIFREADHYYVIQVADPPFGRGGAVRELDVRSKRRAVTVRARRMLLSPRDINIKER
jgi:VWFA-related protein